MHEVDTVITDIRNGNFQVGKIQNEANIKNKGKVQYLGDKLEFQNVPVIAPNGEVIIDEVNFSLEQGDHCFIDGPNGSGKTSVFRIMSELWTSYGGDIQFPGKSQISFIPQTAYLPAGNLRDQIIYPDTKKDMIDKGKTDLDITKLLEIVEL